MPHRLVHSCSNLSLAQKHTLYLRISANPHPSVVQTSHTKPNLGIHTTSRSKMVTISINPVTPGIKNKFKTHLNSVFFFPHGCCYNLPFCPQSHIEDRKVWNVGLLTSVKRRKNMKCLIFSFNDTSRNGIRSSKLKLQSGKHCFEKNHNYSNFF